MQPVILVAVKDLLFGSKIDGAGKRAGIALQWASRFEPLRAVVAAKAPAVLVADIGEPGILEELAAIRGARPDLTMIGFTGHTAEDAMTVAESLGVEVFTRGQFSAQVERILRDAAGLPRT